PHERDHPPAAQLREGPRHGLRHLRALRAPPPRRLGLGGQGRRGDVRGRAGHDALAHLRGAGPRRAAAAGAGGAARPPRPDGGRGGRRAGAPVQLYARGPGRAARVHGQDAGRGAGPRAGRG
ncbi:hypothetical protein EG857_15040, partial [Enterococcus faecalis]